MNIRLQPTQPVYYPDSDGEPMSENDVQYRWIVMLQGNLAVMYRDDPNVYVAADHLIYPVEGDPKIRQAPDTYVAFGRPKGDRGSYKVWLEGGTFPQVVFEVLAPGNRAGEMARKFAFYDRYGVEEYYVIDPDKNIVTGCLRGPDGLADIETMEGWVSPRTGIRFATVDSELVIYRPNGERFLTFMEMAEQALQAEAEKRRAESERSRAEAEKQRAEAEKQRAEAEKQRAEAEKQRVTRLAEKLRELGIDPDTV